MATRVKPTTTLALPDNFTITGGANWLGNTITARRDINFTIHQHDTSPAPGAPHSRTDVCLRSLAFPGMYARASTITPAHNTCHWLLAHQAYTRWQASRTGTLWLKGHAGVGKSTLLKYAVDAARARARTTGALVLSFFLNGRGSELERTPFGLVRALLHQSLTLDAAALDALAALMEQRNRTLGPFGGEWTWSEPELRAHLAESLLALARAAPVVVYVDALDEAGTPAALDLIAWFTQLTAQAAASPGARLHICFACRHYPILSAGDEFTVHVEHENAADIATYLAQHLQHGLPYNAAHQARLQRLLMHQANGAFQWIALIVPRIRHALRRGTRLAAIEADIATLPSALDQLYASLLAAADPADQPLRLRLFAWICGALRPLTLGELRYALLVDPDAPPASLAALESQPEFIESDADMAARLMDLSCGLAEVVPLGMPVLPRSSAKEAQAPVIDANTGVRFVHQTAKDYMLDHGLALLAGMVPYRTNLLLERTCIAYLATDEIQRAMERIVLTNAAYRPSAWPIFFDYAAGFWALHLHVSEQQSWYQGNFFDALPDDFTTLWTHLENCRAMRSKKYMSPGGYRYTLNEVLHFCAHFDLPKTMQKALSTGDFPVNEYSSHHQTPLLIAVIRECDASAEVLLKHKGLDIEALGRGRRGFQTTALMEAVEGKSDKWVKRLLKAGADPNFVAGGPGACHLAIQSESQDLIELLIEYGFNPNHAGNRSLWFGSYLYEAIARGLLQVVQLLVKAGATVRGDQSPLDPSLACGSSTNFAFTSMRAVLDHPDRSKPGEDQCLARWRKPENLRNLQAMASFLLVNGSIHPLLQNQIELRRAGKDGVLDR